jgi:hypothetical protein
MEAQEIKIWKLNEGDYVAAATLDEAKKYLAEKVSDGLVTPEFEEEFIDDATEVTAQGLDTMTISDEDEPDGSERTFREELEAMKKKGAKFPALFACFY